MSASRHLANGAERHQIRSSQRDRIRARDCMTCQYCGIECVNDTPGKPRSANVATIDHRTPLVRGGTYADDNLCVACWHCNEAKGTMTAEEFAARPYRSRQLANAIARFEAMNAAEAEMHEHGLHGGPAYDLARDRFNALKECARDEALLEIHEAERPFRNQIPMGGML